jgi:hypothetical protein
VRVHRDRLAQRRVAVAEVDNQHVADLGVERRAGDVRLPDRGGEPGRHLAVDVRGVGVAARERVVVPLVLAQRRDLPLHGLGLNPVFAPLPAGSGLDLRHVLGDRRPRLAHAARTRVELLGLLRAQRAEQRRAAGQAEEGTPR